MINFGGEKLSHQTIGWGEKMTNIRDAWYISDTILNLNSQNQPPGSNPFVGVGHILADQETDKALGDGFGKTYCKIIKKYKKIIFHHQESRVQG